MLSVLSLSLSLCWASVCYLPLLASPTHTVIPLRTLSLSLPQSLKQLKQRNTKLQAAYASGASEDALRLVDMERGIAAGGARSQAPPLIDLLQLQAVLKLIKRAGQLAESASLQRLLEDADALLHKTMERVIVAAASAGASAALQNHSLFPPL